MKTIKRPLASAEKIDDGIEDINDVIEDLDDEIEDRDEDIEDPEEGMKEEDDPEDKKELKEEPAAFSSHRSSMVWLSVPSRALWRPRPRLR